jgi:hypothetical protein
VSRNQHARLFSCAELAQIRAARTQAQMGSTQPVRDYVSVCRAEFLFALTYGLLTTHRCKTHLAQKPQQ